MILIRGECGSGKSAVLRALEAAPPAGYRAVYVPVPTLDFAGIARWCLDRLGADVLPDAISALRALAAREQLLVLVDDAERLPLDTALALRKLERDARGALALVAACASDSLECSSVVALGEPARALLVDASRQDIADELAAEVRAQLEPRPQRPAARVPALPAMQAPSPPPAVPPARAAQPAPIVARERPALADAPRASAISEPLPAPAAQPPRTVSLSLAIALAVAAFLVPVAFGAGYFVGHAPNANGAPSDVREPTPLPGVAAAPPLATAEPVDSAARAPAVLPPPVAAPKAETPLRVPARSGTQASAAPSAPAPRVATAPPPRPAPVARPADRPAARASSPEIARSAEADAWGGAPTLISVGPSDAAQ